jgi:superfamily I DNA/RNA helicase
MPMLSTLLSQHATVAQDIKQQYLHVLVDEFQDVSPIQMQIITQLSLTSVTVCGDDDQNIFGFLQRNGDNFSLFLDRFPNAGNFERSCCICFCPMSFLTLCRNFEVRAELSVHVKHCECW